MSLWNWALEAYARPGVAEACLELQDRHGQSVPYLLWAAWAARRGVSLPAEALAAGAWLARAWDEAAVAPLRQVRRRLKIPMSGMPDDPREAARAQAKAAELAAEQALMLALEAMTPAGGGQVPALLQALLEASAAWEPQAPRAAMALLAQALA
ncbi:MAG TPA: TIGR02444 family protein [Caulobacteraceae bacterium]|nr:TIGR02444 family protein [Caulobacteraceae bacterium]